MSKTITEIEIEVNDWLLPRHIGAVYERDNMVTRLSFIVDTDDDWSYKLDVAHNRSANVIILERTGNKCSVDLTADMLLEDGRYAVQLRGICGECVRHTNIGELYVAKSIDAINQFPPLTPSEMEQLERRMQDAVDASEVAAAKAAQVGDILDGGTAGQVLTKKSNADKDVAWEDASGGGISPSSIGSGLKFEGGVLSVDTANVVQSADARPVSSAAVDAIVGNINILLANV